MPTPPYLLGRHLTAVTVAGVTVDSNGVLSVGSATAIQALIEELGHEIDVESEDVSPVTAIRMNEVPLRTGHTVDLSVIALSNGANVLYTIRDGFDVCRLVWTEGGDTFIGDYWIGNFRAGVRSRGKNMLTLSLMPIDVGGPQVIRT